MEVHLTAEQETFIQQGVHSGRFTTADEAVQEAISLLKQQELEQQESRLHPEPAPARKSLARLFAESPFRGLDLEFPRSPGTLRSVEQ